MLNYKGIIPKIDDKKLNKYQYLTGRTLTDADVDLYVRNYVEDHNLDINTFMPDEVILTKIVDRSLELEILFRS